jgi:hypothetical protein
MASKHRLYAKDEFLDSSPLDVFSSRTRIVGTLLYRQVALVGYFNPPRYRALKFTAAKDDVVDVWVRSDDGDAVAWILDVNHEPLAWNDDAHSGTRDAHIRLVIPSWQPVFYIVFREFELNFSHFTVHLEWGGKGKSSAQPEAEDILQLI